MNNFHSQIKIVGQVDLKLYDEYNQLIEHRSVKNTITNDGMLSMLRRYVGVDTGSSFSPTYIGIGIGTTTPSVSDTTLVTEVGTRVSLVTGAGTRPQIAYNGVVADFTSTPTGSYAVKSNQISWQATIPAGNGTGAITEAGIFSATTGGSMFARTTFNSLTKAAGSTLYISWTITFPVTYTVTGLGTGKSVVVGFSPTTVATISANGIYNALLNDPTRPTINIQPTGQLCSVSGVSSDNIVITCSDVYLVGGTLAGAGRATSFTLGLKINGNAVSTMNISITATSFQFTKGLLPGETYEIYVITSPTNPAQTVTLTNATGTMDSSNVTNVVATIS